MARLHQTVGERRSREANRGAREREERKNGHPPTGARKRPNCGGRADEVRLLCLFARREDGVDTKQYEQNERVDQADVGLQRQYER